MSQTVEMKRDLVLAPGEYAYLQDETRGQIKTHVGPTVINQTAQDRPVVYDPNTQTFRRCKLEEAVMKSPLASEGAYIVLENPAVENQKPEEGNARPTPVLKVGRKVNIPGPCNFGLWPGQRATVVMGHHLRSNQYLLVRVYNEQEARTNWNNAVAVLTGDQQQPSVTTSAEQLGLTIGKLLVIKGTEVSFYIPPTGVEVVPEEGNKYVRDAVTLERLEYSILIEEDGNKRYSIGPQVVFPKPTEAFFAERSDTGISRKFKAIELNKIQGLHIKVIADYEENGVQHEVGEEMFITGSDTPIYYPRVEHSIIQYGDKKKHYGTAIPNAGEGRYLMNRNTGEIKAIKGPAMLLPDPREQVIVRRILSDKQVDLWYPGNEEALRYNRNLRALATANPTVKSLGFVSEGQVSSQNRRNLVSTKVGGATPSVFATSNVSATANLAQLDYSETPLESYTSPGAGQAVLPDSFERGTGYTQPRTVTLDTKYEGVPSITVWTGYAVMVVSKTGNRRVVKGPATILLDYDESLEVLELSTGKPKTTDSLQKTVYLRVVNNKVSDIVQVRTKDKVEVRLRLSYRVSFDGEANKWFDVENYVKFLCDHCRSVLKGQAQKLKVEDFDTNGVDIVRDTLIGTASQGGDRPGMLFEENGMKVVDVEVLGIEVVDSDIAKMLNDAQHEVVRSNIILHQAEKQLEVTKRQEEIARETEESKAATTKRRTELALALSQQQQEVKLASIKNETSAAEQQKLTEMAREEVKEVGAKAALARKQAELDQQVESQRKQTDLKIIEERAGTEAAVARFGAAQGGFSEALIALSSQETLAKVATAMSAQSMLGGKDVVEVIQKIFAGSPLETIMAKVADRAGLSAPATNAGNRR